MGLISTGNFQPSQPHPPPLQNGLFPTHCRALLEHRLVSLVNRIALNSQAKTRDANKGYKYTTCIIDGRILHRKEKYQYTIVYNS